MPNPKAPRVSRQGSEARDPLDVMVDRLAQVGATADEIQAVKDTWYQFDDDWTPQAQRDLLKVSDGQLIRMLQDNRADFPYEPPREPAVLDEAPDAVVMGVIGPPAEPPPPPGSTPPVSTSTVPALLEWVGGDQERAGHVLSGEYDAAGAEGRDPRKTLVSALMAVIDASG